MRIDIKELEEMANTDIRAVKPKELKDISEVRIDQKLPVNQRIKSFLSQVDNPYIYLDQGMVVKISFADSGKTLQECMEDYLDAEFLTG